MRGAAPGVVPLHGERKHGRVLQVQRYTKLAEALDHLITGKVRDKRIPYLFFIICKSSLS